MSFLIGAIEVHAVELSIEVFLSFTNLRRLPSLAKVRSTTLLRDKISKPFVSSERRIMSMRQRPLPLKAILSLPPA